MKYFIIITIFLICPTSCSVIGLMASGQASSAYNLAKKNEKEFSDMRSTLEEIEKQIKELKVQMEKVLKEIDKIK